MKKLKFSISIVALALLCTSQVFAADGLSSTQNVTLTAGGSSIIGVYGPAVSLSLNTGATAAGASLMKLNSNSLSRLRISSLSSTKGNQISAQVTTGDLNLTHTQLFLRLKDPAPANTNNFINYTAAGGDLKNQGNVPYTVGEVTLDLPESGALIAASSIDVSPSVLLADGIGFCWSGTAEGDGYIIEYTYSSVNDGGTAQAPSTPLTITYTIAETL